MKVFIAGNTLVFASELKKEDVDLIGVYEPDVLTLKDGDDVTFRAGISECAEVGKYGIYFDATDSNGFLRASVPLPEGVDKRAIADKYGAAISCMLEIERRVAEALPMVRDRQNAICGLIEEV